MSLAKPASALVSPGPLPPERDPTRPPSAPGDTFLTDTPRRARGVAAGKQALFAKVDPLAMEFVRTASERLGVSQAELVDELLMREVRMLDESGVPAWWSRPWIRWES